MTPLALGGLGVPELLIILAVVLLLFGGSRLAGLGKSSGRALREFKEETKSLPKHDKAAGANDDLVAGQPTVTPEPLDPTDPGYQQPPRTGTTGAVDPTDARRDV